MTTPPHIPTGTIQCSNCHTNTATSFTTYTMSHTAVTSIRCDACHNGSYKTQGTKGAQAKPNDHPKVTQDCGCCHTSTTSWGSRQSPGTCTTTAKSPVPVRLLAAVKSAVTQSRECRHRCGPQRNQYVGASEATCRGRKPADDREQPSSAGAPKPAAVTTTTKPVATPSRATSNSIRQPATATATPIRRALNPTAGTAIRRAAKPIGIRSGHGNVSRQRAQPGQQI